MAWHPESALRRSALRHTLRDSSRWCLRRNIRTCPIQIRNSPRPDAPSSSSSVRTGIRAARLRAARVAAALPPNLRDLVVERVAVAGLRCGAGCCGELSAAHILLRNNRHTRGPRKRAFAGYAPLVLVFASAAPRAGRTTSPLARLSRRILAMSAMRHPR